MSASIEWAEITERDADIDADLVEPGGVQDAYGNENDGWALCIGECVIEGAPAAWIKFAKTLLHSAQVALQEEEDDE